MESKVAQQTIDKKNESFWNELCGTQLAKELGVVDSSQESLAKFDKFYMDYYPYLESYLFLNEVKDKNVLEVGLGYGTISQKLAMAGANYHGLDIASNAVAMATHRLKQHDLQGDVRTGSMLECPFHDNYFDYVISIGCFHHTGDFQKCIGQTYRVLKKGGKATIMVYNKFSLRQWMNWPSFTAKNLLLQMIDKSNVASTQQQRGAYDVSSTNESAPETKFFSKSEIKKVCKEFKIQKITPENFDENVQFNFGKYLSYRFDKRIECLDGFWARHFGLDLYIQLEK
ncbi:class I SAM-dependent methyltransferase [Legionella yabuuchiae]|uniref:class I SAM-dependent methyltransferase n=1 Tax=Legionella yabuuchiae TaxID=376727 RepID=UPI0010564354|nr:class I SAM-dependent methyltransferase [Legionella yabuuchiae]